MWLLPVSHTNLYQGICHILNLRYRLTCSSFVVVVVVEGGGRSWGLFLFCSFVVAFTTCQLISRLSLRTGQYHG